MPFVLVFAGAGAGSDDDDDVLQLDSLAFI